MAEHEGFIKIDRNMLNWRWVNSPTTGWLFLIILLKANYKKMTFEDVEIQPGQLVTSYPSLSKSSGLTIQQCRSALKRLKSTGELTVKLYPKYQVITIINWHQYQNSTGKLTVKQQASSRQATGNQHQEKEYKERKKVRNIPPKSPTGGQSPSGDEPVRGTDAFRNRSHLLLKADEGTVDDIPMVYRDMYDNFPDYWRYRNQ